MKVIETKEFNTDSVYEKRFFFDQSVQLDSFIALVKQFENEQIKMAVCNCNTFNENGNEMYRRYTKPDDILKFKDEPSPYATFSVDYCNRKTEEYSFSICTGINLSYMRYIVDKKKILGNSTGGRSKK